MITSRQNSLIVKLCKLDDRKQRDAERLFRFDGIKLFCEAVNANITLEYVLIKESDEEKIQSIIKEQFSQSKTPQNCEQLVLSDNVFEKLTEEKSAEGIICIAKYIDKLHKIVKIYSNDDFSSLKDKNILLVEDVRDPGNLGTIIRSSFAFCNDVLILGGCADIYNSRVVRAAMGALFKQEIIVTDDLVGFINGLVTNNRRVLATALDQNAQKLQEFSLLDNDCFVIGNEGHGLSKEALNISSAKVYIPMQTGSESLNAGVAASLCLWQRYSSHKQ